MNQVGVVVLWCFWLGKFMHWTWGRAKRLCLLKIVRNWGTSLAVQWLRLQAPSAGGLGLIPGHGTRSCVPKVRPGAAKKKKKKWGILRSQEAERTTLEAGVGKRAPTENLKAEPSTDSGGKKSRGRSGCGSDVCVCVCVHARTHSTYTPIPFTNLTRILSVKSTLLADVWGDFF